MQCTIEKLTSLQQLQITLHHPPPAAAASSSSHPQLPPRDAFQPLCSVSNQYPYKPILHIKNKSDASSASPSTIDLPLNVRIDLSDPKNTVTPASDATILSLRITADLAEPESEDDFPTSREIMPSEYANVYCRCCGASVFAPRPAQTPFTIHSLPSPYWTELTDLWFCHSGDNAHVDRIASTQIRAARGKILVDKLLLRVHREDVAQQAEAWRRHPSVQKVIQAAAAKVHIEASDESMSDVPPLEPLPTSSEAASRDIWSPLPCTSCDAILGSILLTIQPSANPVEAIQPNPLLNEVRLFKYQLSNCFRKRISETDQGKAKEEGQVEESKEQSAMDVDSAPSAVSSSISSSPTTSLPSCLCSSYSPSPLLTCSNLYLWYTFENFLAADLEQRHARQPIGKFVIECEREEDDEEAGLEANGGNAASKNNSASVIRLFVTQWEMPLSSNIASAFPYTPAFHTSNSMVPVVKVEYAVHRTADEEECRRWIYGRKKTRQPTMSSPPAASVETAKHQCGEHHHGCSHVTSSTAAPSSHSAPTGSSSIDPSSLPFPSNISRLSYPEEDFHALRRILDERSRIWPESQRGGMVDATMRKSCLVKLSKNIKPTST